MTVKLVTGHTVPKALICAAAVFAVIATVAVIVLSLKPSHNISSAAGVDKVVHFMAYGVLAGLWSAGVPKLRPVAIVLVLTALGGVLELGQGVMGLGRTASVLDGLANFGGASLGAVFMAIVLPRPSKALALQD